MAVVWRRIAWPVIYTSFIMIGAVAMTVLGDWNPINALKETASGIALVAMLLLIILGQWSANIVTSIMPPAYICMNAVAAIVKKK